MLRSLVMIGLGALVTGSSSCFLVSVPVKATGELIEKSADSTQRALSGAGRRVTTPAEGRTDPAYEPLPEYDGPYEPGEEYR